MNTNSNVYTVIYTTIIVVVVAAVLAFASSSLKSKQTANIKAETLSQMMTAAGLGDKESFSKMGNDAVLSTYSDNIEEAFAINVNGEKVRDLKTAKNEIELIDNFKPENKAILNGGEAHLPVYKFKSGVTVIPVYGAGLWGPIWGYIALQQDLKTIVGAYFDHESETPGLGAKIKDEASFKEQFAGKVFDLEDSSVLFEIVKGGAPEGSENKVDAISGATMTCNGLNKAINTWVGAYANYLKNTAPAAEETVEE
ncbi:MAG: NADH:ubiquinone reductase (Na(+)-transporting) subunit C [Bacteroidales bacterium]|nr:NADH:ubiquinone reductase (Na(+)-transporting) subunit C [Bacteroidales bacterium]